jgi:hypothetical protein
MKVLQGDVWKRRGVSLLWSGEALGQLAQPAEVLSIRVFFALLGQWPDELPSNAGQALVVGGLEGCLDLMSPTEAEVWMKTDVLPAILAFQDEYGLDAALVFWLPTGKNRVKMNRATEEYSWICAAPYSAQVLELGRILWAGAASDVGRILYPNAPNQDPDGIAWAGLHHPRLS